MCATVRARAVAVTAGRRRELRVEIHATRMARAVAVIADKRRADSCAEVRERATAVTTDENRAAPSKVQATRMMRTVTSFMRADLGANDFLAPTLNEGRSRF